MVPTDAEVVMYSEMHTSVHMISPRIQQPSVMNIYEKANDKVCNSQSQEKDICRGVELPVVLKQKTCITTKTRKSTVKVKNTTKDILIASLLEMGDGDDNHEVKGHSQKRNDRQQGVNEHRLAEWSLRLPAISGKPNSIPSRVSIIGQD